MKSDANGLSQIIVVAVGSMNLDASTSRRLRSDIAIRVEKGHRVIVDMTDVQFADSSGISLLTSFAVDASEVPSCVIVHCSRRLEVILQRIPRERLPMKFQTLEKAIDAFRDAKPSPARPMTSLSTPIVTIPIRQSSTALDDRWPIESV